jgi:hypothetical protein
MIIERFPQTKKIWLIFAKVFAEIDMFARFLPKFSQKVSRKRNFAFLRKRKKGIFVSTLVPALNRMQD